MALSYRISKIMYLKKKFRVVDKSKSQSKITPVTLLRLRTCNRSPAGSIEFCFSMVVFLSLGHVDILKTNCYFGGLALNGPARRSNSNLSVCPCYMQIHRQCSFSPNFVPSADPAVMLDLPQFHVYPPAVESDTVRPATATSCLLLTWPHTLDMSMVLVPLSVEMLQSPEFCRNSLWSKRFVAVRYGAGRSVTGLS
jgi:hypothetical protein